DPLGARPDLLRVEWPDHAGLRRLFPRDGTGARDRVVGAGAGPRRRPTAEPHSRHLSRPHGRLRRPLRALRAGDAAGVAPRRATKVNRLAPGPNKVNRRAAYFALA